MGLSLTVLPLKDHKELFSDSVPCYDRISFDRDYKIFAQFVDCGAQFVDCGETEKPTIKTSIIPPLLSVGTYEDEGLTWTRVDNYGEQLTYVYAQQFKGLVLTDKTSPKNKAILAFIAALPVDTPIILLWR